MKKLKQALSLTLALVLSLALAVPAMAIPVGEDVTTGDLIFSQVISVEDVKDSQGKDHALYTAEVGTEISLVGFDSDYEIYFLPAAVKDNIYTYDDSKTPISLGYYSTLSEEHIGLWYMLYKNGSYINVVPAEGSAPTEPAAPAQPAAPTEPAEPAGPVAPAEPAKPAEPVKPAEPAAVIPEGSVAYTVQKGDTLSSITTNYYGNNAQRYALYSANKEAFKATKGKLVPGMVLAIPAALDKAVRIPAPVAGEGEKLYSVKLGDTLGQIAANQYGSANEYKAIFERNKDRLTNANTIYEGQVIVLPAKK